MPDVSSYNPTPSSSSSKEDMEEISSGETVCHDRHLLPSSSINLEKDIPILFSNGDNDDSIYRHNVSSQGDTVEGYIFTAVSYCTYDKH